MEETSKKTLRNLLGDALKVAQERAQEERKRPRRKTDPPPPVHIVINCKYLILK